MFSASRVKEHCEFEDAATSLEGWQHPGGGLDQISLADGPKVCSGQGFDTSFNCFVLQTKGRPEMLISKGAFGECVALHGG